MAAKRDKGGRKGGKAASLPRPTDGELSILRVLWARGPQTVRDINEVLNQSRPTGLTTTLKLMQIMTEKGLLVRDESSRPQVFRPAVTQEQTQQDMLGHLLDGAFGGSTRALVLQALQASDVDAEELARVEKLLDEIEREQQ